MTQIIATLEKGADPNVIRKVFENVKGVLATTIAINKDTNSSIKKEVKDETISPENKQWLDKLNRLYNNVNRDMIDLSDERTQYILSK